jgi:glycerophosphoryl diester phosphodiesterase
MSRMKRFNIAAILIIVLVFVAKADGSDTGFQIHRIAHAGGGLGKTAYTNSYQALDVNIDKGFRYFEIDFVFTSDDRLVCLHDWRKNFKRIFGFETKQRLSLEEFERLTEENKKFTNCTLEGLAEWMRKNPTAYIVTDVKDDNLKALRQIHEVLPDADKRVIPQIYEPSNFDKVSSMGFHQLIWTLYRYQGGGNQVIQWVERWQAAVAVTMPKDRAESPLPNALGEREIPTYVNTINKSEEMDRFMKEFGVTEIYTDFLPP